VRSPLSLHSCGAQPYDCILNSINMVQRADLCCQSGSDGMVAAQQHLALTLRCFAGKELRAKSRCRINASLASSTSVAVV
jgi:hypothetical protein